MSQQLWADAMRLFCDLADLPEAERTLQLRDRQQTDPALTDMVAQLFAAHGRTEPLLDPTARTLVQHLLQDEDDPWLGQLLGPYRLQTLIGVGGMGRVYRALREDFGQVVAIKVLADTSSADRLRRFEFEKHHLARLHHPGIASIFHAATHTDGTLFFAMEYVDGIRLTDFCTRQNLSRPDRLRLLLQVCQATQAAHNVGVLHQDLKPSNILVTPDGTVKLLDFGIAERLTDPHPGADRLLSPAYASPEFEAAPPSIASDVFSLGMLLYDLLARLPFPPGTHTPAAIRSAIRAGNFPPISTLARETLTPPPTDISPLEWQELDAIAAHATAPQPDGRYTTVDALALDLRLLLASRPIDLLRDSRWYVARKFVQRHRLPVLAALLTAATFLLVIGVYTARLRQSTRQAQAETARVLRLQAFERSLFVGGVDGPGLPANATAETLLDHGVLAASGLSKEPRLQADEDELLGEAYGDQTLYPKAEALLRQTLTLRSRLFGPDSSPVAETLLHLSQILGNDGQSAEAKPLAERAVAITSRTLPPDAPIRLEAEAALAEADNNLDQFTRAIAILEPTIRHAGRSPDLLPQLSTALNDLAIAETSLGRLDLALIANQQSLEIDRRRLGDRHPDIAAHLLNLAAVEDQQKDFVGAARDAQQALLINTNWFGPSSPQTLSAGVALGQVLVKGGNWQAAEPILRTSLTAINKLSPRPPSMSAQALNAMGMVTEASGRLPEADAFYHQALAIYRARSPQGSPNTAVVLTHCAEVSFKRKQLREAEHDLREALRMEVGVVPPADPRVGKTKEMLQAVLAAQQHLPPI